MAFFRVWPYFFLARSAGFLLILALFLSTCVISLAFQIFCARGPCNYFWGGLFYGPCSTEILWIHPRSFWNVWVQFLIINGNFLFHFLHILFPFCPYRYVIFIQFCHTSVHSSILSFTKHRNVWKLALHISAFRDQNFPEGSWFDSPFQVFNGLSLSPKNECVHNELAN